MSSSDDIFVIVRGHVYKAEAVSALHPGVVEDMFVVTGGAFYRLANTAVTVVEVIANAIDLRTGDKSSQGVHT